MDYDNDANIIQIIQVRQPQKVDREPYAGPVIEIPSSK